MSECVRLCECESLSVNVWVCACAYVCLRLRAGARVWRLCVCDCVQSLCVCDCVQAHVYGVCVNMCKSVYYVCDLARTQMHVEYLS